jgi:hypothetical protein
MEGGDVRIFLVDEDHHPLVFSPATEMDKGDQDEKTPGIPE